MPRESARNIYFTLFFGGEGPQTLTEEAENLPDSLDKPQKAHTSNR